MSKRAQKGVVSFETEGDLHDEVKSLVEALNSQNIEVPTYLMGVNQMYNLFDAIYQKNLRLLEMCQEKNSIIIVNASKIKSILDVTEKDKDTLKKLKIEFEEASKIVKSSHNSEVRAHQLLASLRKNVTELSLQVQRGEAFSFGEDGSLFEISQEVKNLSSEKDKCDIEIRMKETNTKAIEDRLILVTNDISNLKNENERLDRSMMLLDQQLTELNDINGITSASILELKPKIAEAKVRIEDITKEKAQLNKDLSDFKRKLHELHNQLSQHKEEGKAIKDKTTTRTRYLQETRNSVRTQEADIEEMTREQTYKDQQIEMFHKELTVFEKLNSELTAKVNELLKKSETIVEDKQSLKKVSKTLQSKVTLSGMEIVKSDEKIHADGRNLSSVKGELAINKQEEMKISGNIDSLRADIKNSKAVTRNVKGSLQEHKEKVLNLLGETDTKRAELFALNARIQLAKENRETIAENNDHHIQELRALSKKTEHQIGLTEKLRDERNTYKRMFEALDKENQSLSAEIDQVTHQISEFETKIVKYSKKAVSAHFETLGVREDVNILRNQSEKCLEGLHQSERIVSRLQAEVQTLNYILTEAENDKMMLLKERDVLINNLKGISAENSKREKLMEELSNRIKSDEGFIKNCAKLYEGKISELTTLVRELELSCNRTKELEAKREKAHALEYEIQRASSELNFEKQKFVSLLYEFSVQRNIHRWEALAAVDPAYVSSLKYRSELVSKLDVAHRDLVALLEEKTKLKEEIEKLSKTANSEMTREDALTIADRYRQDLSRIESQIEELRAQLKNGAGTVNDLSEVTNGLRSRLVSKREDLAVTRSKNYSALKREPFFITESSTPPRSSHLISTPIKSPVVKPKTVIFSK